MNTSDDMRRLIDQINSTGNKPEIIVEDDQSPMARFAKWSLSEATSEDVLEPKKDIIDDDEEVVEEDNHLDRMFAHHMAGHEDYFDQYNMFKGVNEDDEEERYRDFDMDGESADMRDIDPDEDFNPEYLGPTTPADFEGDAPLDAEDERRWLYKYLAQRELGLEPWVNASLDQLKALAARRGINVERVLRGDWV